MCVCVCVCVCVKGTEEKSTDGLLGVARKEGAGRRMKKKKREEKWEGRKGEKGERIGFKPKKKKEKM